MADPAFKTWKVRQFCYFWLVSTTVTAEQITSLLGIEPDRAAVRGSQQTTPRARPAQHSWKVECCAHGRIDEQVTEVLRRLEPVAHLVRQLVDSGDVDAGLMMVREFGDPNGGYDAMGWVLEPAQVALVAAMGAEIQSDEYLDNGHPSAYGDEE